MKHLIIKSARKLIQNKKELEDKLGVKIIVKGVNVTVSGREVDEYFASRVLEAVDYPFLIEDALLLKNDDFMFEIIPIKEYTRRSDLSTIKARLIGKKGKTKRVLENLSESEIAIKGNNVAVIGPVEHFAEARQAIISLIQGSKQGSVYSKLERHNRDRKKERER